MSFVEEQANVPTDFFFLFCLLFHAEGFLFFLNLCIYYLSPCKYLMLETFVNVCSWLNRIDYQEVRGKTLQNSTKLSVQSVSSPSDVTEVAALVIYRHNLDQSVSQDELFTSFKWKIQKERIKTFRSQHLDRVCVFECKCHQQMLLNKFMYCKYSVVLCLQLVLCCLHRDSLEIYR